MDTRHLKKMRFVGFALLVGLAMIATACLETDNTPVVGGNDCVCGGIRCVNSVVGRSTYSADEEAAPCSGCHVEELGRCVDGCATTHPVKDVPGCPVAYACKSWDRVKPGAACQTRFDCEPGEVDGSAVNTLDCVEGKCTDVGAAKWNSVELEPRACDGEPLFGPHPQCGQATCLSRDFFENERFCSVARCLAHSDCPEGWSCRCLEQPVGEDLKATRWCVPSTEPEDSGEADAGIEPDAGE
ncbi:MAG: hypothetical protein ACOX6T_18175 [Myxococcales bacterium]|jgi:hypothetical protein